jgi:hypothetical protein
VLVDGVGLVMIVLQESQMAPQRPWNHHSVLLAITAKYENNNQAYLVYSQTKQPSSG